MSEVKWEQVQLLDNGLHDLLRLRSCFSHQIIVKLKPLKEASMAEHLQPSAPVQRAHFYQDYYGVYCNSEFYDQSFEYPVAAATPDTWHGEDLNAAFNESSFLCNYGLNLVSIDEKFGKREEHVEQRYYIRPHQRINLFNGEIGHSSLLSGASGGGAEVSSGTSMIDDLSTVLTESLTIASATTDFAQQR